MLTGHYLRRTSASLLTVTVAVITAIKRNGRQRLATVAKSCIADLTENNTNIITAKHYMASSSKQDIFHNMAKMDIKM